MQNTATQFKKALSMMNLYYPLALTSYPVSFNDKSNSVDNCINNYLQDGLKRNNSHKFRLASIIVNHLSKHSPFAYEKACYKSRVRLIARNKQSA